MDEDDCDFEDLGEALGGFGALDEALAIYQGPRRTRLEAMADLLGDVAAECQASGVDFLSMAHAAADIARAPHVHAA